MRDMPELSRHNSRYPYGITRQGRNAKMAKYSQDDLLKDFAKRTMQNLHEYSGDFEITQLINSFLGVLVFAFQKKKISQEINYGNGLTTSVEECGWIRNSIAHFNFNPESKEHEITQITFQNEDHPDWSKDFTVSDLKAFLVSLNQHIQEST
jgi:hypothetical protein